MDLRGVVSVGAALDGADCAAAETVSKAAAATSRAGPNDTGAPIELRRKTETWGSLLLMETRLPPGNGVVPVY